MSAKLAELEERYIAELQNIDELALVVLKGHLLLEELLSQVIETFVFHAELAESARLSFGQKVSLARSMSLDESENSMWSVVSSINSLRNDMAHAIDSPKRAAKLNAVRENYLREIAEHPRREELQGADDLTIVTLAVGLCLGFVHTFTEEVDRLKGFINTLDIVINPHRHNSDDGDERNT